MSVGIDIDAGCGQLKADLLRKQVTKANLDRKISVSEALAEG